MSKLIIKLSKLFATLIIIFDITGCSTIRYYSQSIQGQLEVIHNSESINTLLHQNNISEAYKEKLNLVLKLRAFSIKEMGLPDNNSYTLFADMKRDYVIWNIFANPEFSLEPLNWCYFIVGCLNYRGYFSKKEAEQEQIKLQEEGYDTYLGGVAAYSTLGWFDDPVFNSMLRWNESYLATVMFHELAHQQFYVKNDTELNESYADAIAHIGVKKWLKLKKDKKHLIDYEQNQERENKFVELINHYKSILKTLYQSSIKEEDKRKQKRMILEEMEKEYLEMSRKWQSNPYEKWFRGGINNAKLASVITYRKYVPALLEIYDKLNHELTKFYSFSKALSKCKELIRKDVLNKRLIEFEC